MPFFSNSCCFKIKKWLLCAICLLEIIIMIGVISTSGSVAENMYNAYVNQTNITIGDTDSVRDINNGSSDTNKQSDADDVDPQDVKNMVQIFLIVLAVLSIIINSFGLIGAVREHLCLSMTFAILMLMSTFAGIVSFLLFFRNLGSISNLPVTILAFAFVKDLKRVRAQRNAMIANPVVIQTMQPMPQIVNPLYATDAYGQQYPQQQYNACIGLYGAPPLLPPNYSNIPPSGLQNEYMK